LHVVSRAKMIPTAKNCCCFLSLKNGTLLIGLIQIGAGIGYITGGAIIVSELGALSGSAAVGSLMIVSGVLLLLSTASLLVGALKVQASLLVPWMVYILTFIITNSFLNIIAATQYIQVGFLPGFQAAGDVNAAVAVISFLLQLYFLFVVNGLYTEIKGTVPLSHTTTQSAPRPWTTPA